MGLYEKVMGLYEIANTDNPNICSITFNPKEYFEKFKNQQINKKHKGVRRDNPGMNFEKLWMKKFLLKDKLTLLVTTKNLFEKEYKLKLQIWQRQV